jgi:hypothetical protein
VLSTSVLSGLSSVAAATVKVNTPPYGGTMALTPDPPYQALTTDITITAEQWFDDVQDYPLVYAFYFVDSSTSIDSKSWTALGQETVSNVKIWRDPPAGNYTLTCRVVDTFGSSTFVQKILIVEAVCHLHIS